jgi:hypothetical protein
MRESPLSSQPTGGEQVEGFARHFNNIKPPSLLSKGANYHLFKVRRHVDPSS